MTDPLYVKMYDNTAACQAINKDIERVVSEGAQSAIGCAEQFERRFINWCSTRSALATVTGLEAMQTALALMGARSGDRVVVPALTSVMVASALQRQGLIGLCVDVDPETFTIDPIKLTEVLARSDEDGGPPVRGIIATHLFGHPAPIERIRQAVEDRDMSILEDCDLAQGGLIGGRRTGEVGDLACFALSPYASIAVPGSAGLVASNSERLAPKLQALRRIVHGKGSQDDQAVLETLGFLPQGLNEYTAVWASARLDTVDGSNLRRQRIAGQYGKALAETAIKAPVEKTWAMHAFQQYPCLTANRDAVVAHFQTQEIGAARPDIAYLPDMPLLRDRLTMPADGVRVAERCYKELFILPLYPTLSQNHIERVCNAISGAPSGLSSASS